ncbi:Transcriptional regulatory protein DegU [Flavobacteriales bacterium]|nr:Transcriptional regulatory protein DegU [Flavobacteriales bacterium]GIK69827.1 MAG: DNA-binding response regulator [Bacteroidota bacterium]CAG0993380.1 Transcriptional regulatory protein DegU [Flavobacteriales bacterium]
MKKRNILLVDDHVLVRNGLKLMLQSNPEVGQITEASNGHDAINLCSEKEFDMVFMDINMPEMNGIETSEIILKMKPQTKIVCLSMHNEFTYISKMLDIGAYGYLLKDCEPEEFSIAIRSVANNQKYYSRGVTDVLIKKHLTKNTDTGKESQIEISGRELEVLKFIIDGLTNAEIAGKLVLSIRTVDSHRRNILKKTNCKNTAALVKYAIENRLV